MKTKTLLNIPDNKKQQKTTKFGATLRVAFPSIRLQPNNCKNWKPENLLFLFAETNKNKQRMLYKSICHCEERLQSKSTWQSHANIDALHQCIQFVRLPRRRASSQ